MIAAGVMTQAPKTGSQTRTLVLLWTHAVAESRSAPAFLTREQGGWHQVSWGRRAARSMNLPPDSSRSGMSRSDRVAILSRTRLEMRDL